MRDPHPTECGVICRWISRDILDSPPHRARICGRRCGAWRERMRSAGQGQPCGMPAINIIPLRPKGYKIFALLTLHLFDAVSEPPVCKPVRGGSLCRDHLVIACFRPHKFNSHSHAGLQLNEVHHGCLSETSRVSPLVHRDKIWWRA